MRRWFHLLLLIFLHQPLIFIEQQIKIVSGLEHHGVGHPPRFPGFLKFFTSLVEFDLLIDLELMKKDIQEMTGISQGTLVRMNTNEYVLLEVIDKLCKALKCRPEDLIEYVEER